MNIQIEIGFNSERKTIERTEKGKSLIALPTDYTVIDIETTGLDCSYNSIIEVSAVRVRGCEIKDKFSSLIKPPKHYPFFGDGDYFYVDEFITKLTGITNEMLDDAPEATEVLPEFAKFIGDDILIGHNVNFDVNFLYEAMSKVIGQPLKNNFIDTMRFSRKLFPASKHHRACDLAKNCDIPYENAHRALNDSMITFSCFEKMREIISNTYESQEDFIKLFNKGGYKIDCSSIVTKNCDFDEEHPFYHKTVVFTGALNGISRKVAMQHVVDVGGYVADRNVVVPIGQASVDFNGLITLNDTGAFLWKKLVDGCSYDELLAALLAEYDVDEATAKEGIDAFLNTARSANLIDED